MSVPSVLKGAIAQVNPFDNGATYGTYNNGIHAKPPSSPQPVTAPSYGTGSYSVDTSQYDKQIADSNASIKALQASLAAQPKLPYYNTAQAWANAQKAAESSVNPVYQDKLNAYLQKAALARTQQEQGTARTKEDIGTGLAQSLEDIGTTRTRTTQDTQTSLADQAASEAYDQQVGGTQFDRMRAALLGGVADAGLTTSGLGQQQESQAIDDRNVAEKEQGRQYQNKRDTTNLNLKRANEDLDLSSTRAQGGAQRQNENEDIKLKNFIDNASLDEKDYRSQNELDRLGAIAGETNNQYKINSANFIQSLIGSGARAQDIALAQQIYG